MEQKQSRAERELESWKVWAQSMAMLRQIHREVAPIIKRRRDALANSHNPAKHYVE